MKIDDLLLTSCRMVGRHWVRYRTVMIAIALGTIGFILIRTMADSVQSRVANNLELIGESTIVEANWEDRRSPWHLGEYLERDIRRLKQIPNATVVAPVRYTARTLKASSGNDIEGVRDLQITCIDHNFWQTISPYLVEGRYLSESDVVNRSNVCMLHKQLASEFFGNENPIGKKVFVMAYPYTVIGILGGPGNTELFRSIFVPISVGIRHLGHIRYMTRVRIRADSSENVRAVRGQVEAVLKSAHPAYQDAVWVRYHASRLERVNLIMSLIMIFGYAALVTVFVLGKVGLTNVMLSAIQERTREVGLRKALGATDFVIRAQFVIECVLVSIFSGFVGVVLGVLISVVVKELMALEISNQVLIASIVIDLCITTVIGLAAGIYPSFVASRLDIVSAMRYD